MSCSNCYHSNDEDSDSGLVDDAFDVLPDEDTLALEDYNLDLDLSEDHFGKCASVCKDFSDLLDLDETDVYPNLPEDTDDGFVDECTDRVNVSTSNPNSEKDAIDNDLEDDSPAVTMTKDNGKLVSFSKEQARQWRRKRILKSNEKKLTEKMPHNYPAKREPLLPLPKTLKPFSKGKQTSNDNLEKEKYLKPEDKLADPLLGGERISARNRKGPLPMKLRALPESFWKEPQSMQTSSLAQSNYSVIPPLFSSEGKGSEEVIHIRPVTPPDEKGRSPRHSPRNKKKWVMTSPPDTELLFSLFDQYREDKVDERLIVKRGRPKKVQIDKIPPPPPRADDEDPCIVEDLATKLSLNNIPGNEDKSASANLGVIRIGKGNHSVEFLATQAKEHYPEILDELVTHM